MYGKILLIFLFTVTSGNVSCFAHDKTVVIPLLSEKILIYRNSNIAEESPSVSNFTDYGIYIEDSVTGLQWIKEDDNVQRTFNEATAYCNNLNIFGTGWRVPDKNELISIADYANPNNAINSSVFPGNNTDDYYWTATNHSENSQYGWMVWFGDGSNFPYPKSETLYVRCVRGYPSIGNLKRNDNGTDADTSDDTVTDFSSGLTWESHGGSGSVKTWSEAISYCQDLIHGGFSDWRLPNVKELDSITDPRVTGPSINRFVFYAPQAARYWSSTSFATDTNQAQFVNFDIGYIEKRPKYESWYVRCVRGPDK